MKRAKGNRQKMGWGRSGENEIMIGAKKEGKKEERGRKEEA